MAYLGIEQFFSLVVEIVKMVFQHNDRKYKEASAYFEQLSSAMERVVESLRKDEVPRISGNEMNTLIHAFAEKTNHVLGTEEADEVKSSLLTAAATAKMLDAYILEYVPGDPIEREQRLASLERITGHCRAIAGLLRKPA